jgi:hypothetical protein
LILVETDTIVLIDYEEVIVNELSGMTKHAPPRGFVGLGNIPPVCGNSFGLLVVVN